MSMTPAAGAARGRPISLDELILLNDEIRALIRAGVPLDVGLRGSAARIRGRLGRFTERLAARLAEGSSLSAALDEERGLVPATYRAIIDAGSRSGRFEEVLASVSRYAAAMRDLKTYIARSLVYPGAVLVVAYALFVGIIVVLVPWLQRTYDTFRFDEPWWLRGLWWLHQHVTVWGWLVPCVLLTLLIAPSLWGRLTMREEGRPSSFLGPLRWIPGFGGVLWSAQLARFAHLLSIQLEFGVPFPAAARLSAASTGDRRLMQAIGNTVERVERGQPLAESCAEEGTIPGFLRWMMALGERQSSLASTLRQAADVYQQRATIRAEWMQRIVPVVLVLVVGGLITAFYALSVFVPMASLWKGLGA